MPVRPLILTIVTMVVLAGCTANSSTPPVSSPTAASAAAGLHCQGDDHGLNLQQLGWGFCYPASWKFRERDVSTTAPPGVDTTLDIVDPQGLFGFMIVGSYDRHGAATLHDWLAANAPDDQDATSIQWGNAVEAVQVTGQLKRYAMTRGRVYLLNEREGAGNLDLETEMSKRLGAWYFSF